MDYAALSASERRFLPPAVAVSTIAFALTPQGRVAAESHAATHGAERQGGVRSLWAPLVRRTRSPFLGLWALPGGGTRWDETLSDTASRTLSDAVGRAPGYLEQLYSFGGVERSAEAQRLVTIAYWATFGESRTEETTDAADPAPTGTAHGVRRWDDPEPAFGTEAARDASQLRAEAAEAAENVAWFAADDLPELAFDHAEIIAHALNRLRSKTEYEQVAHRFLGDTFTLAELRAVYEAVQGRQVDPANFRRQALSQGTLFETGGVETGSSHRPAKLYRFVASGPEASHPHQRSTP